MYTELFMIANYLLKQIFIEKRLFFTLSFFNVTEIAMENS